MVDKQAMTQSEKLCDPCQFNTEIVKAVSWCSTCEEGLCKSCDKCHRIGHLKLFFAVSLSTEDETKVVIQDSQNVCKHGRYFGT
jgi:hypothetical protein